MVARSWKNGIPAKSPTPGRRWFPRKEGHLTFLSNFRGHEACMLLGRVRRLARRNFDVCVLMNVVILGRGYAHQLRQVSFRARRG